MERKLQQKGNNLIVNQKSSPNHVNISILEMQDETGLKANNYLNILVFYCYCNQTQKWKMMYDVSRISVK